MTPPSRQDDGNVRAPALSRAVGVVAQVVAVGRVRWWSFDRQLGVSARTSPRPTPCGEGVGQTQPVSLHVTVHCCCCCCCCCVLVANVALLSGSALRGNSCSSSRSADGSRQ